MIETALRNERKEACDLAAAISWKEPRPEKTVQRMEKESVGSEMKLLQRRRKRGPSRYQARRRNKPEFFGFWFCDTVRFFET